MAKGTVAHSPRAMTKSEIVAALAEKVGITKKQANRFLEAQAELAYQQAKNSFVIPGIGKLVLVKRPARQIVMRFGPKAGQVVQVPERQVLRFRVAKAAKDAIIAKQ